MEPVMSARVAILHLLRAGEAHGSELIRRAGRLTGGRVRLTPARVYPILADLARRGLIAGRHVSPGGARGARQRTVYSLTEVGRKAAAEQRRLFAAIMDGTPLPPDARERARMAERLLQADALSRSGREVRAAFLRARG
jgi:DNA-binding PadR family transcriptional regulator